MSMELDQLRVFLAVAETKSFTEAAHRLYLSHSTISRRVSSLEEELGTSLFERDNAVRGLTPAGELLYVRAKELISLADRTENELHDLSTEK